MSRSIDERIVQMEFDNDSFEKDAKTTMSTLDKLKDKLNFDGVTESLRRVGEAASNTAKGIGNAFSGISLDDAIRGINNVQNEVQLLTGQRPFDLIKNALATVGFGAFGQDAQTGIAALDALMASVDQLKEKFSPLGIAGQQAIRRITDAAIDLGNKMVHGLAIDQVQQGFSKYEKSVIDTIAIMNQAEESEEKVNSFVKTLSWYSDATSFDINSMTSALKSFAQQGIQLQDAIPVIMGIGNSVTYAGVGAKEGSAAFDYYSKAISQGYLDQVTWKSLSKTIGAATMGLKKQFIEAAEAEGTLHKVSEGTWRTLQGEEVTLAKFQSTLSSVKGKWLTTDVINRVFGTEYGGYTARLAGFTQELQKATGNVYTLDEAMEELGKTDADFLSKFGELDIFDAQEEIKKTYGDAFWDSILSYNENVKDLKNVKDAFEKLGGTTVELGKKYLLSATQARTFTEAVDATKDAASSVWKDIFTDIIGSTNEAIEIWTAFQDPLYEIFVEPLAAMRQLTYGWKQLGGRTMMLEGIARAWNNIKIAIEPVAIAFRSIFPATTSKDLLRVTAMFTNLQFQLKGWLNHDFNREGLIKTLEGLFAVVDILKEGFKALFDAASPIGGVFTAIQDAVLDFTGSIGENLVKLRDYIKEHHTFSDALLSVKTRLSEFAKSLKEAFDSKAEERIQLVNKAVETLKKIFGGLKSAVVPVLDAIKAGFENIGKALKSSAGNLSLVDALEKFGKVLALVIARANASTLIKNFRTDFLGLTTTLSSVRGFLKTLSHEIELFGTSIKSTIQADTLLKVAGAIFILSLAMSSLAAIDPNSLSQATFAMGALFVALAAMFKFVSDNGLNFGGGYASRAFTGLALSMLILSFALKTLASTGDSFDAMLNGLIILFGIFTELAVFLKVAKMDKLGIRIGLGFIGVALGIRVLASAVKSLSKVEPDKLGTALAGLVVILAGIGVLIKSMPKNTLSIGAGLLMASIGIGAIALSLKLLGTMSIDKIGLALKALGGALIILAVGVNAMRDAVPGAIAMGIAAAAIALLTPALIALSLVNPEKLAIALGVLAGAILIFVGAAAIVTKFNLSVGLFALAGSLAIFAVAVDLLAAAFLMLSAVKNPVPGLLALAGSIAIFATAALFLQAAVVPMIIFAGVVALIGVATAILGGSLMIMGGGISVIAAGVALIAPLIPVIFALSGALTILGLAAVADAVGVLALGAAFVVLAKGSILVAPAIPVMIGLAGAIALLAIAILGTIAAILYLTGHLTFANDLAEEGEKTKKSFSDIWTSIELFFLNGLKNLLGNIPIVGGWISESIDKKIQEIETGVMSEERSSKMTQTYISGITETWSMSEDDLRAAGFEGSSAVVEGVNENEGEFSKSGSNFLQGFLNGLKNKSWLGQIGSQARAIGNLAKNNVNMSLGIQSPSEEMEWSGEMTDEGFAEGMENGLPGVEEAVGKLSDAVLDGMANDKAAYELGLGAGSGYGEGWNEGLASSLEQMAPDHVLSREQLESLDFALPENYTFDWDSDFDTNPTVTPVLDLSEIQNGADDIGSILNGQSVQANIDGIDSRNSQFQETVLYDLQSMRNDIQILAEGQRDLQARDRRLISGIQDAFEEVGVYIDGDKIGRFVERYQNNARRAAGV